MVLTTSGGGDTLRLPEPLVVLAGLGVLLDMALVGMDEGTDRDAERQGSATPLELSAAGTVV